MDSDDVDNVHAVIILSAYGMLCYGLGLWIGRKTVDPFKILAKSQDLLLQVRPEAFQYLEHPDGAGVIFPTKRWGDLILHNVSNLTQT
jgi:hypothetical protein